jgi:hypothetical protein
MPEPDAFFFLQVETQEDAAGCGILDPIAASKKLDAV